MNSIRPNVARTTPVSTIRDISVQQDPGRQTPRRIGFGTVLARGVQTALMAGANLLAPIAPGGAALAASIGAVAGQAGGATGVAGASATGGISSEADLLKKQEQMRAQDRMFNLQYLELQRHVQADQRQFQVMSNLMRLRHETVKTAINNIR